MNPLVSVIIPTYNRAHLIGETLDSVRAQTYSNWECIVIDDSSTDYTMELLEFYHEKDSRIQFYKRPKNIQKGSSACRNVGLEKSIGEYIQFLDSDDTIHESKFQKQLEHINTKTICTCKWGYFSGSDYFSRLKYKQKCYRHFNNPSRLLYYFGKYNEFLPLHNYLIPVEIVNKAGNWNVELGNNDDAEYMSRILIFTNKIKFISDVYAFYRVEGKSTLSGFQTEEKAMSAIKAIEVINENLKNIYPKTCFIYTKHLKKNVLQRIQRNYPEIVAERKHFLINNYF